MCVHKVDVWTMSNCENSSQDGELESDGDDWAGDCENGEEVEKKSNGNGSTNRLVTLQSLLGAGVLEPGEGAMTIDYLGQKFTGDLLLDGKIKSHETEKIYGSPTAWAVSCKKILNPEKQSGCGWATVRYKGTKLDAYKNLWIRNQYDEASFAYDFMEAFTKNMIQPKVEENDVSSLHSLDDTSDVDGSDVKKHLIVKHGLLGNRQANQDENVLVESVTFASLGKIQPFLVSLSTNAALVVDLHCHLTMSEVVGYLAGTWDVQSHVITISHAFPLRCRLNDFESAPRTEAEALQAIRDHGLTLLGWYHSHPRDPPTPTLRDIDTQLDYQLRMKGNSDSSYLPCIGLICCPYDSWHAGLESQMVFYWVAPPPESKLLEYGKPMTINHTSLLDESIPHEVLMQMKKCADFYRHDSDYIAIDKVFRGNVTYLEKLKASITPKWPRNLQSGEEMWDCVVSMLCSSSEEPDTTLLKKILAISNTPCLSPLEPEPTASSSHVLPPPSTSPALKTNHSSPTPTTPNHHRRRRSSRETKPPLPSLNNYFVGSDLANALLSASLGWDPAALSLLNMSGLGGFGGMMMSPYASFKEDGTLGLMKPPPPPSLLNHNSCLPLRNSRSRSSSSSPSPSPSCTVTKDLPAPNPNKVPKIENNWARESPPP